MRSRAAALRSLLAHAPLFGVASFLVLYAVAAWLYPGGTRADPTREHFSFARNYWCDLLDVVTYGGRPNPARPVAFGAMVLLCLGLSALWWTAPLLFSHAHRRAVLVRGMGIASAIVGPFVATVHHDWAVRGSALLGFAAFVTTLGALRVRTGHAILWVGGSSLAAACVNYVVWETGLGLAALPIIQKVAFATFLYWVVLVAFRARAAAVGLEEGRALSSPVGASLRRGRFSR